MVEFIPELVLLNGEVVYYDTAVAVMDDEIRERLYADLTPCTNQEFIDAYVIAHTEKSGEDFEVS